MGEIEILNRAAELINYFDMFVFIFRIFCIIVVAYIMFSIFVENDAWEKNDKNYL